MRGLLVLATMAAVLSLAVPAGTVRGQHALSGMTTIIETRFEANNPPAPAEVVQVVLEFPPAYRTELRMHGGLSFVTVLQGEMTLRAAGAETFFQAGQGWMLEPGVLHTAGNDGGVQARILETVLVPKGAAVTTILPMVPRSPDPITVAEARFEADGQPVELDVVHRLMDLGPGAVAAHTHPGPNFVLVLEGDLTLDLDGVAHHYTAGDSWVEPANAVHGASAGPAPVRIVTSTLVPRGAPAATPAQ
jgi:quercetin dioxygenase-like cupin family protein